MVFKHPPPGELGRSTRALHTPSNSGLEASTALCQLPVKKLMCPYKERLTKDYEKSSACVTILGNWLSKKQHSATPSHIS